MHPLEADLRSLVEEAGFRDVRIVRGADVFSGAPRHSNAAEFGTVGARVTGRR